MTRLLQARGTIADGGYEAFGQRDIAFHKAIVDASGNRAIVGLYDFFTASILETIHSTLEGDVPEPDDEAHAAIVEAIATGDPDRAAAAVRAFMAPVLRELDRLLSQ